MDTIESYEELDRLPAPPHGPDCPCLICADLRVAYGHEPILLDPWDLLGYVVLV